MQAESANMAAKTIMMADLMFDMLPPGRSAITDPIFRTRIQSHYPAENSNIQPQLETHLPNGLEIGGQG
jgi:hypothetical protein